VLFMAIFAAQSSIFYPSLPLTIIPYDEGV